VTREKTLGDSLEAEALEQYLPSANGLKEQVESGEVCLELEG
jgi:hypothetical protein